jgi:hypothetical protein
MSSFSILFLISIFKIVTQLLYSALGVPTVFVRNALMETAETLDHGFFVCSMCSVIEQLSAAREQVFE